MNARDRLLPGGWAVGAALVLFVLFGMVLLAGGGSSTRPQDATRARDFSFRDINPRSATHGQDLTLSRLWAERGVALQFIASWCKPCRDELPELQELYAEQGAPIVLVAADESGMTESVLIVAERSGLTAPILFVPEPRVEEIESHYTYDVLPATYFIDRDGAIRRVHEGAMGGARLARAIDDELAPKR